MSEDKLLNRADWYLRIGYDKAVEDIIISLAALRVVLYNRTQNHSMYVKTTDKAFEEAGKISERFCK